MPPASARRAHPAAHILFVTPEAQPFVSTGGLGEVAGSLPRALCSLGLDVRVLLPGYTQVLQGMERLQTVAAIEPFATLPGARLLAGELPGGVPAWVVECPPLYARPGGPYQDASGHDWADNAHRFGLLCRAGAILAGDQSPVGWHADVVHCNDWQTGLIPALLRFAGGRVAASVMGIHNALFQGNFPPQRVADLGLPPESWSMHGVEFHGNLSFLKAGIYYADRIVTVSPTYAREIQTEAHGFGMHGLLHARRKDVSGILNGIDTEVWNPATDPRIATSYDTAGLSRKAGNRAALRVAMELAEDDRPVLGMVCRLTHQKGVDVVADIAERLLALPAQIAVLGSGDRFLEGRLRDLASVHPGSIAVRIGYDETLAHLIEAGADIFLMPSRFEPCGLNQMYSQRYGTPPVVHATGGLLDSVTDTTPRTLAEGTATGFQFTAMTGDDLFAAVERAVSHWRDRDAWRNVQQAGMSRDFSWAASASCYRDLYLSLLRRAA